MIGRLDNILAPADSGEVRALYDAGSALQLAAHHLMHALSGRRSPWLRGAPMSVTDRHRFREYIRTAARLLADCKTYKRNS